MKKILILLFIFFFSLTLGGCEEVFSPVDEVTKYEITLEPRNDGSMDMLFSFDWKVLNDTREGPLTWVIIGIPNEHVDEITALTGNIEDIGYSSYQGGSFVRVDFTEPTYADETIHFAFSTHQSHLYNIEEGFVDYSYQPGWFSEIEVKQAIVRWEKTNVLVNNANSEDDNYWIWDYYLNFEETIEVHVRYSEISFPELDYGATNDVSSKDIVLIILIIIAVIAVIMTVVIVSNRTANPYYSYRGFGGLYYTHWGRGSHYNGGFNHKGKVINNPTTHRSAGLGGGSSCACACACACAGGGRAGCSRKEFSRITCDVKQIHQVITSHLEKEKEIMDDQTSKRIL